MRFLKDRSAQGHQVEIIIVIILVVLVGVATWTLFGNQIIERIRQIMSGF